MMEGREEDETLKVYSPPPPDRIFSDMYDRLVTNVGDLPGLVAYGLYQREKREWAEAQSRSGIQPTRDDAADFSSRFQATSLLALRSRAEAILTEFAETIVADRRDEFQRDAFNDRTINELNQLHLSVNHLKRYRHHVYGHVLGFICLVTLYYIFTQIVSNEPTLASALDIFKHNEPKQDSKSPPPLPPASKSTTQ